MAPKTVGPRRRATRYGGALVAGVLGAAGALGVAAYTTLKLNAPMGKSNPYTFSPWELGVEHEVVTFRGEGGITLRGWWLGRPDTRRVVIGCTGHRGAKHELLGIGSGLWRAGNNVLLFDFRGRGDSDQGPFSLAFYEMADLEAAIDYVFGRMPDARLGVVGYSMGAAVALSVAARDERVAAVVADSSFATIRGVIQHAYSRYRMPVRPMLGLASRVNRLRYGYAFDAVEPINAVAAIAPRPLLLIHGAEDSLIPVAHSEALYAAAGEPKELWVVPQSDHCGAYFVDRSAYVARVAEFFRHSFGEAEAR
jgi:uncharacterized protein